MTLFLAMLALPAFAVQSRNVVDDVIKMAKSGVAEETMLDFVAKAPRYDVSADDVVAMSDANVPRAVIRAVVKGADNSEPGRRDGYGTRTVVVAPAYGYYPYYGYGYYPYYDPFWYGPSLSIGFGFGFGHGYYGGHGGFHHGHR